MTKILRLHGTSYLYEDSDEKNLNKGLAVRCTDLENTICWITKSGAFHRIDGPAVETVEGDKEWWVDD